MLPIPKMGAQQSKNALQQSRQRGDPFCVPGKRAGKFVFLSQPKSKPRGSRARDGSRCRGQAGPWRDCEAGSGGKAGAADGAEAGCE